MIMIKNKFGYFVYLLVSLGQLGLISCAQHSPYYRYELMKKEISSPPFINVALTAYRDIAEVEVILRGRYRLVPYERNRQTHFISPQTLLETYADQLKVEVIDNKIRINGIPLEERTDVVLIPLTENFFKLGKRAYRGYLRIKVTRNNRLQLVNILDLETYLYGVVGCEMDARYPEAALAAQAIASRSLAIFRMKRMHLKRHLPSSSFTVEDDFDLTDDDYSQVYWGLERENEKTREAVDKTRGVILSYEGALFEGLFHDTCGGQTEPAHLIWGGLNIAPLSGRSCGYCFHSKFSQWKVTFSEKELIEKLSLDSQQIEDIIPLSKTPSGRIIIMGIKIPGRPTLLEIKGEKLRQILGYQKLRSCLFQIQKSRDHYEFIGRGWGHGVGMCQEGAHGMARQGFNTLQILEYYYPGARVVKIY